MLAKCAEMLPELIQALEDNKELEAEHCGREAEKSAKIQEASDLVRKLLRSQRLKEELT